MLRKGVYYRKPRKNMPNGQVVILSRVKHYRDALSYFIICDWEYEYGLFDRVLIKQESFSALIRLGDL
jgi:hypothetical protein